MNKISTAIANTFCPQPLYLFGTYGKDGKPNFSLVGWVTYFNSGDYSGDKLHIVTCMSGRKLTKERLHADKQFSVNLVTQSILPVSDYYGTVSGYNPEKMNVMVETFPGKVLNVPIIKDSPWSYEVEVEDIQQFGQCDMFICKVHNVMAFEVLLDNKLSMEERMRIASPVVTVGPHYFGIDPVPLGNWGNWRDKPLG